MKDRTAIILIIVGIVVIIGLLVFIFSTEKPVPVYTYEECVSQGNVVDEIDGMQRCTTKQGKVFFKLDKSGFCGQSTSGVCESDSDCVADGCSGQVCRSTNESPVITTCEWRECYDDEKYNVGCGCIGRRCGWA